MKSIKSLLESINNYFIHKEKVSYIIGRISFYILIGVNAIFIRFYPINSLAYILLTIIEICWALCLYFNYYISKNIIKRLGIPSLFITIYVYATTICLLYIFLSSNSITSLEIFSICVLNSSGVIFSPW